MKAESAIDRLRQELARALDDVHVDLERIDILVSALNAFSKPVPDYEPAFQHIHPVMLTSHQI